MSLKSIDLLNVSKNGKMYFVNCFAKYSNLQGWCILRNILQNTVIYRAAVFCKIFHKIYTVIHKDAVFCEITRKIK